MKRLSLFVIIIFLVPFVLHGQRNSSPAASGIVHAPIEQTGYRTATSYDSLSAFLSRLQSLPSMKISPVVRTRGGRAVWSVRIGEEPGVAKLKILLFAQQHGDEPSGKEALTMFLARCASGRYAEQLRSVELLVIPQMNPDGAEQHRRRSGDGYDLNRTHLILHAPETMALHRLGMEFMPDVSLDMHEYLSSESWYNAGMMKMGDVQFGMLTNLNTPERLRTYQHEQVYPYLAKVMAERKFLFHEYLVGAPDMYLRHSTTEPNDGRQSFGMLGTLSFIQEGKNAAVRDSLLQRRATSQLTCAEGLVTYCSMHADEIRSLVASVRMERQHAAGKPFVLRMNHFATGGKRSIPVRTVPEGRDTMWSIHPYLDLVRPLKTTSIPSAYVVPAEFASLPLLQGHGVRVETVDVPTVRRVQVSRIDSVGYEVMEEDSIPRLFTRLIDTTVTIQKGDLIIPTDQIQSYLLASAFEAESQWGLAKYPEYEMLLKRREFPFMRIP